MKIWVDGSDKAYGFDCECKIVNRTENMGTNNENEYNAVLSALEHIVTKHTKEGIEILSDSKLIVEQLNKNWHIKEDRLRELAFKVFNMISENGLKVKFTWIQRKNNLAGKLLG